jgi:hypothetical protein
MPDIVRPIIPSLGQIPLEDSQITDSREKNKFNRMKLKLCELNKKRPESYDRNSLINVIRDAENN